MGGDLPVRGRRCRRVTVLALVSALLADGAGFARAAEPAPACTKADFEAVVDEAAQALRDLNMKNKPTFQERLRQLKDKHGWSHEVFLKEAQPYVRDDEITALDTASEELLGKISSMGQEGAEAKSLDCGLLGKLRGFMGDLVAAQTKKWTYMFAKIDKELSK